MHVCDEVCTCLPNLSANGSLDQQHSLQSALPLLQGVELVWASHVHVCFFGGSQARSRPVVELCSLAVGDLEDAP